MSAAFWAGVTVLALAATVLVLILRAGEANSATAPFTPAVAEESAAGALGPLNPSRRARVRAIIRDVFGARSPAALRVASCETGGTFYVRALGSAGERGLFQIHPVHFYWLEPARLYEPRYNSRIAFRLSRGGRDWSPWSCRP